MSRRGATVRRPRRRAGKRLPSFTCIQWRSCAGLAAVKMARLWELSTSSNGELAIALARSRVGMADRQHDSEPRAAEGNVHLRPLFEQSSCRTWVVDRRRETFCQAG